MSRAIDETEGVIRFQADHRHDALTDAELLERARVLAAWRRVARGLGVLGCDPDRYGGAGFGNISLRVGPANLPPGCRAFLITGTQTGGEAHVGPESLSVVTRYALYENRVESRGMVLPSSESMTHAAVYDLDPALAMVIHGHAPPLWQSARALDLPTTDPDVCYGTPAMAAEVARTLVAARAQLGDDWRRRVLIMGGHEDGILAVGETPDEAGAALVSALAAAWQQL